MKSTLSLKKPANAPELVQLYKENELVYYYPMEELFNVLTHFAGVVFGVIMLVLMLIKASTPQSYAAAVLSNLSFIIMFMCSAVYHGVPTIKAKKIMRRVDYSSINLTVIACGTGACLLYGFIYGYVAYACCIAISLIVTFLCMRYFGKTRYIAVASNFVNGALLAAAYILASESIPWIATQFYIAGLVLSLVGALLFGVKLRYAHTVFHVFVLVGPMCCMLSNYFQLV